MSPLTIISIFVAFIFLMLALTVVLQFGRRLSDGLTTTQKERPFVFAIGVGFVLAAIVVVSLSHYSNLVECWPQHRLACFFLPGH